MWRGNLRAPDQPTNHPARFKPLIAALAGRAIEPNGLSISTATIERRARHAYARATASLVWINPLQDGLRTAQRSIRSARGRSAGGVGQRASRHDPEDGNQGGALPHPRTGLGIGHGPLSDSFDEFSLRFPVKLAVAGARVLKPLRGNDGRGVLKVGAGGRQVRCGAACRRRQTMQVETVLLAAFVERMRRRFAAGGLIDQAFQPNVAAGMVRCYMSQDRVVGFSEQAPRSRADRRRSAFGMNSAKTHAWRGRTPFQDLRQSMEATGRRACSACSTSRRTSCRRCGMPTSSIARPMMWRRPLRPVRDQCELGLAVSGCGRAGHRGDGGAVSERVLDLSLATCSSPSTSENRLCPQVVAV